jgi:hypothetical protein
MATFFCPHRWPSSSRTCVTQWSPGWTTMGLGHRQALSQPSLYALFFAQEHLPGLAMPIGAHRTDGLANLAHQGFA